MSFHLIFYRYDHELLSPGIGSGDASVKAAIDAEVDRRTAGRGEIDPEWEAGRDLAHRVIDHGLPKHCGQEELRHRLAAEWLTTVFRIPGSCDTQDWRWQSFYDTLHTVPGFSDPIPEIVSILDEGRPYFGSSCPEEAYYGHLTHEESCRLLDQCQRHRAAFEADDEARHCIPQMIRLLEFALEEKCRLWFGFW